jgi:hypothetical protein
MKNLIQENWHQCYIKGLSECKSNVLLSSKLAQKYAGDHTALEIKEFYTESSKKNSGISLFNISVNSRRDHDVCIGKCKSFILTCLAQY